MGSGTIVGSIFVLTGLGFLIGKAFQEALAVEVPIDVPVLPPIEEEPVEIIDVIVPDSGENLIVTVGF